ncbi:SDR family NAD(P)-dependent oxidoreductase [Oceanobacillus senegalensis]|uniref:SDR family NAD(P)-dependent oxidoreductase n=1 Tax=Oceanobacillus senegalensis TaxID=1936063 RepID=UPI000A30500E|nr:SDR family NAD(P)-dependent oxidoreductase [Oceanobacillus senegalensis]
MYFKNRNILVIGGTGTIGKCIVKHLLKENPKVIKIFSRDEYKQQQLKDELGDRKNLRFIIGDVRDYDCLFKAMREVDFVFHLAAMKQVDTCEYNPYEAVKTNVQGTHNVIEAAIDQNVRKVVFTSSDKAISPTNTYGSTKLLGERLISATEYNRTEDQTVFASVRFGNVMGSRGSVIPLFKEQIKKNKRVTVTDKNMTRFMMTLTQATQLTINALKDAKGGEIFVLKMPVINIGDLADILIEETCKKYHIKSKEVVKEVIGLRPGEKMYEELMTVDEARLAWELPDMYVLPGTETRSYRNAKKASTRTYSSMDESPLNRNELRLLLKKAGLI